MLAFEVPAGASLHPHEHGLSGQVLKKENDSAALDPLEAAKGPAGGNACMGKEC